MCNFELIHQNSFGCVVQCSTCKHVHLGFGTVLTSFSLDEFQHFTQHIDGIFDKNYAELLLTGEKIYLNTESKKFAIVLNPEELYALNHLLMEAALLLEVHTLLKDENIND